KVARQVAHDIKSPLSLLTIAVRKLEQGSFESRHTRMMGSAVNRIESVTRDLLRPGAKNNNNGAINITLLIEEVVADKLIEWAHRNPHIFVSAQNCVEHIDISESDLMRIISNAINNAIEAVELGEPKIGIELSSDS